MDERLTSAFRRSLELPHEVARIKNNDELDLLLEFGYIEAARMWVALKLRNHWICHLKIYEKTTLPIDAEAARKDAKRREENIYAWLDIAKATGRADDIVEVDRAISLLEKTRRSKRPEFVVILVEIYTLDGKIKYFRRALSLAQSLGGHDDDFFWEVNLVEAWRALVRTNDSPETREGLRLAEERRKQLDEQEDQEYLENSAREEFGGNLDLKDPRCCLILAETMEDVECVRRALELLKTYDGTDRTVLFLEACDLLDRWLGKRVLSAKRKFSSPEDPGPPPIPNITRNCREKKRR